MEASSIRDLAQLELGTLSGDINFSQLIGVGGKPKLDIPFGTGRYLKDPKFS